MRSILLLLLLLPVSNAFPSSSRKIFFRGGGTPKGLAAAGFNNAPLFRNHRIFLGANLLGYALTVVTKSHYHVDLLGSGAFAAAAFSDLKSPIARVRYSSMAVCSFGAKLASFLFYRVIQTSHDARLDDILASPSSAAGFWIVSAAWGIICSLPHALGATSTAVGNPIATRVGLGMFGAGILLETAADATKWIFKQNHPGQFCNVGVWRYSQHPNWCGNLLLWTGIFVLNAPALIEPITPNMSPLRRLLRYRRLALAAMGPLFMYNLFDAQSTGRLVPEAIEKSHARYGYGKDPSYTSYVDDTPLLFPGPFRTFSK